MAESSVDQLERDSTIADLSEAYYTELGDLRAAALAGGCPSDKFDATVLGASPQLSARSASAAAARATALDEFAWRLSRATKPSTTPVSRPIPVSDISELSPSTTSESASDKCLQFARTELRIVQQLSDALLQRDLIDYVRDRVSRNAALIDQLDGPTARFAAPALAVRLSRLAEEHAAAGCTDPARAKVLLDGVTKIAARSPASALFLAEQTNNWVLQLTGI